MKDAMGVGTVGGPPGDSSPELGAPAAEGSDTERSARLERLRGLLTGPLDQSARVEALSLVAALLKDAGTGWPFSALPFVLVATFLCLFDRDAQ